MAGLAELAAYLVSLGGPRRGTFQAVRHPLYAGSFVEPPVVVWTA